MLADNMFRQYPLLMGKGFGVWSIWVEWGIWVDVGFLVCHCGIIKYYKRN